MVRSSKQNRFEEEERRRRRWTLFVVAYCSMATGLAMTLIAFYLGTEIATYRVVEETRIGKPNIDPGSPFIEDIDITEKDVSSCITSKIDAAKLVQNLYGASYQRAELNSIFFSPVTKGCVYEATVHWTNSRGTGVTWMLEGYPDGPRLVVQDALVGADDYARLRRIYERKVQSDFVEPPDPAYAPF